MNSHFFNLNRIDLVKGLAVAVLVVFLGALQQGLTAHGFDVASYDWGAIIDVSWKAAGAYLIKNLFTTQDGAVFGVIK